MSVPPPVISLRRLSRPALLARSGPVAWMARRYSRGLLADNERRTRRADEIIEASAI